MFKNRQIVAILLALLFILSALPGLAQDMAYQQAPMLDDAVASGELPPVEERLPLNPLVVEPLEEIGTYGGTLRRGSANLSTYLTLNYTREPLIMWHLPVVGDGPLHPNLAESWEHNEDFTEWTVYLREGVKWSDGHPFTAEDVEFYWNDIAQNPNVTVASSIVSVMLAGQAPVLEVVDDFTIKFIYHAPFPLFAEGHASTWEFAWPKHFMSQYHPDYNTEATYEDLNFVGLVENGRGRVTLKAWMLEEYIPGDIYRLVRNPYYWKVDPEGNQLPYMDYAVVQLVEDRQAVALGNVTGQFDLDAMWVGVQHLQLFTEAIRDGRDISLTFADFTGVGFYFNLDAEDPVKRAAFRDLDFRRAFSMALNRAEIGNLFYAGLFQPAGSVFAPASGYYTDEDAAKWSAYDPDAANALLDEAGYLDVTGDGFRDSPNGEPLQIILDVGVHDLYTPVVELVVDEYMADIGLNVVMNVGDQTLVRDNFIAGEFEVHTWDIDGLDYPMGPERSILAPVGPNTPPWHLSWSDDPVDEDFVLYSELFTAAPGLPEDERNAVLTQASGLLADNVWFVATGFWQRPLIKSNRLGNTPDYMSRNSQVNDMAPWMPYLLFEKYLPGEAP
jgi:peptide/nickel transport system substrate-binding protein